MVRRAAAVLLILSSLAVAVTVGAALGRSIHSSTGVRPVHAASVGRPATPAVFAPRRLQRPLRPLRESLAALLRRRVVGPRALNAPGIAPAPLTCAVADATCSLHPCVEFATAAPSPAVAMLSSPVVAVRRSSFVHGNSSVYRNSPSVSRRNRYCRAVPAAGQTRLVPVSLTR
jgi:hypothetical protein